MSYLSIDQLYEAAKDNFADYSNEIKNALSEIELNAILERLNDTKQTLFTQDKATLYAQLFSRKRALYNLRRPAKPNELVSADELEELSLVAHELLIDGESVKHSTLLELTYKHSTDHFLINYRWPVLNVL